MAFTDKKNSPSGITDGIILADKPIGFTSFDLTRVISKAIGIKKAGHSGTLDKEASGLMIVAFGKATKLLTYLIGLDKRYIGDVTFGKATTTDDAAGETVAEYSGIIDETKCRESLAAMQGTISQIPPRYSAIHIGGQRAYQLANNNEDFDIAPRNVTIYNLSVIGTAHNTCTIDVRCSSGTYIRSIARDAGTSSGYGAYISRLRRTEIGSFHIEDSFSLEQIQSGDFEILSPLQAVNSIGIPVTDILPQFTEHFLNGKPLRTDMFCKPIANGRLFVRHEDRLLGMLENGRYKFVY